MTDMGFLSLHKMRLGHLGVSLWMIVGLLVIGIFGRLPFASAPFVNLEYFYHQSAELIASGMGFQAALQHLFQGFNNPLGSVLAIAAAQNLFGSSEWTSRLPSMLSWLICVGVVYIAALKVWSPWEGALSATIMGFSPLFWVYGGIAYPDVPFTALTTIAMLVSAVASYRHSQTQHLLAAALLGFATLIRYNGILFYPVIAVMVMLAARSKTSANVGSSWFLETLKVWFLYAIVSGIIIIPYLLWTRQVYGVILRTGFVRVSSNEMVFHVLAAVPRLGAYLIWLGAFTLPMVPIVLRELFSLFPRQNIVRVAGYMLLVNTVMVAAVHQLMIGYPDLFGEMQLGWMERLLPLWPLLIVKFCLLCAGEIVLTALIVWGRVRLWPNRCLALWVLIPLLAHSFYRGTQRYSIFILPPLAMYMAWVICQACRSGKWRWPAISLTTGYVIVYLGFAIFTSAYYAVEGYAAADVAKFINANRINISASIHNLVLTNSAYLVDESLLNQSDSGYSHQVTALGRNLSVENAIYVRDVRVLGVLLKRYAVVES